MSRLLLALVLYTTAEGVYLDEGARAGWRVGDEVEIEGARLVITDITDGHARAEPLRRSIQPALGAAAR
ncbi:hypothetical protein KKF91_02305, partial [Myxococcota bacterium]|nr:hypothetical protein [Myxococcota bacterium]